MNEAVFFVELKNYVFEFFKEKLPVEAVYHNYNHTYEVVQACMEIGNSEGINIEDFEALLTAAWLHDTGYILGFEDHESKSKKIATDYLKSKNKSESFIQLVCELIDATRMPQKPKNKLQNIICDADLFHLGTENFNKKSILLRSEFEQLCNISFSNKEWLNKDFKFLSEHKYFTDYAFVKLNEQKTLNVLKVKKDLKKLKAKLKADKVKKELKAEEVNQKKQKELRSDRGVETMWRVTLRNHIKLSDIADTKANILLSVSAIILSIILTTLVPKLDKESNYYLIYPTAIFLFFTVATIISSILATRPKVTSTKFNDEDIKNKKVNLLFFGNFYKMKMEAFEAGILEVMNDRNYLYKSLTKDLYFLGIVLAKKYKLLRIAYNIFMVGIVISVIAFVISFRIMRVETGVI